MKRQGPRRTGGAGGPGSAEVVNLEMIGDKVKVYSLQNLLRAKRSFKKVEPPLLGEILQPWFARQIEKPGRQLEGITELWLNALPEALADRTRLAGLARGTLTVQVASSPVRSELDGLLRQGLLQRLQTLSNGAIYRVKTIVDALPFRIN